MLAIISTSAGVRGGRARNEPRHGPLTAGKLITRQLGCSDGGSMGGVRGAGGWGAVFLSMSAGLSGIRFQKTRICDFFVNYGTQFGDRFPGSSLLVVLRTDRKTVLELGAEFYFF
jgi:hypothetical protein